MKVYYIWTDDDMYFYSYLSLEPKEEGNTWESQDCWDIKSLYHLLECVGDITQIENGMEFFTEISKLVKKGKLPFINQ